MILGNDILKNEGHVGWRVKKITSGGTLCVHDRKEIWIDEEHIDSLPWVLHEVAHIKHPEHSTEWADHYTALMDKYHKMDLAWHQREIRRLRGAVRARAQNVTFNDAFQAAGNLQGKRGRK